MNKQNFDESLLNKKQKKKPPSIWKLLMHLSGKKEIILMLLGTLGSVLSAISSPIMSYNFGGAINDFSDLIQIEEEIDPNSEKVNAFKESVDNTIKRYLILGTILFISHFLQAFGWQYSAFLQIHRLKEHYFFIIMSQEQEYFDKNNSFELVTKVQTQLQQIELGLGDKFGFVIQKIFNALTGMTISFLVNTKLSLIVLSVAPLTLFLIFYFTSVVKNASKISKKAYQKAGGIAEEMIYNIQTIYSFLNLDFEMQRFNRNIDEVFKTEKSKALKTSLNQAVMGLSSYLSFTVAIFFGKKIIINNKINNIENGLRVGDILIVILSMGTAVWSFRSVAPNLKIIIDAATSSSDYFKLCERRPKIYYNPFPIIKNKDEIKGKIEFKNVYFSYDSQRNILDNFSLKVDSGKKVALVGESGCGKSTVVNLLERIYELDFYTTNNDNENVTVLDEDKDYNQSTEDLENNDDNTTNTDKRSGIFLDGEEIKNYNLEFYRSLIGYVQQEPVLFNKSVRENIIFGREDTIKKMNLDINKLMMEACDLANVSEFINRLEGGLDYKVGIQGSKLSGGQKQRIAIARAVLLNPKIIILDEATSALDYKNELDVQKALDNLKQKNITTFVISHRLNTIINSDMIYYMKDGKIAEKGTHRELLYKNGLYKKLIQNQLQENGEIFLKEEDTQENTFEKDLKKKRDLIIYDKTTKNKGKMKISELFKIVVEKIWLIKCGIISGILLGFAVTFSGYFFGFTINALSQENVEIINKDTNLWGTLYSINSLCMETLIFIKLYSLDIIACFLTANLRKMILKKYMELDMSFFDKVENSPGALLSKLSIDTVQLNSVFQIIVGDLFFSLGVLISGVFLAMYYDWRLTTISLCFIPFIIISNLLVAETKRSGRKSYKKNNIEAGGILSESVLNTKTIFSFNFQKESVKLYMEILNSEKKSFVRDSVLLGILTGFGVFCSFANYSALFYFSKKFFLAKSLTYKNMNVTIQILNLLTSGLSNGVRGVFDIKIAKSAFISIFKLLNTENEIDHTPKGNKNNISPYNIKGKIEFKNVFFKYPISIENNEQENKKGKEKDMNNADIQLIEQKKYILKDISFTVEPGQKIGIVGFSGSGKSTIIKLIERFYQPSKGDILIDGIDIKKYNLYELRKKIGLVSQEPILFKRSVYENIKYGKLDARQKEVIQAAEDASINYLFSVTDINKQKAKKVFSGGEKQRISIARAFLKNPTILLLDEPTSALDKKNETEINKNLDRLMKGRTTFIVTHRLDSIIDADLILVFENGKLIQQGTHYELIHIEGPYKYLFALKS